MSKISFLLISLTVVFVIRPLDSGAYLTVYMTIRLILLQAMRPSHWSEIDVELLTSPLTFTARSEDPG